MAKLAGFLSPQLLLLIFFLTTTNALYNVVDFGARPNSQTDSARPFLQAWAAACSSSKPASIHVPNGRFYVSEAKFNGPCRNNAIKFTIDGVIVAPSIYYRRGDKSKWIEFNDVDGVSIDGGVLDGRGGPLWACKLSGRNCPSGATTLTFSDSKNIEVVGMTSSNSELYHIVIEQCQNVKVVGVNIVASGTSPNTDGIHVQMSSDVSILQTNIKTGDDCVSVGPGTSGLWIQRVFCGPGHGISIGSLGKGGDQEEGVQNVTVKSTVFSGTQNGLRIKTWGTNTKGFVSGVTFIDAVMRNVQNPIIIDQNYCPHSHDCPDQSSHVRVSNVKYEGIRGTSATEKAVNFDCSASNPCSGISLKDIKLTYENQAAQSFCQHAVGEASGSIIPPSCL